MKRTFADTLVCPFCHAQRWDLVVRSEDTREVREGTLACLSCNRQLLIAKGIVNTLDPEDQLLAREIKGWNELAGTLGEGLVSTMTALPYYPHIPWPHLAPDFFQIFEMVSFAGARVVDIGAGRTWSTRHLATIGQAAQLVAIDVLATRFLGLETADIFFAEDGIYFERICGDIHHMPLPDSWADAVFSAASIHHSSDLEALFSEVWRVLRPGGVFVFVSEPSKKASIQESQPQNEETSHGINEHIYSLAEYLRPLEKVGFRSRRLVPRSLSYRLLYRDNEFLKGLPPVLRRFTKSEGGRRLFSRLLRSRLAGSLIYGYANLPLSVIAKKPAGA